MHESLLISPQQRATLQSWLDATGEFFVYVELHHSGGSGTDYFVRSVDDLQKLLSDQTWSEITVTVFRRLQFPIRGMADDALLERALRDIPDGRWFHVARLDGTYPRSCWWRASGQGHSELREEFQEVRGEFVAIGEHPFDGDINWFDSNPEEAMIFSV